MLVEALPQAEAIPHERTDSWRELTSDVNLDRLVLSDPDTIMEH